MRPLLALVIACLLFGLPTRSAQADVPPPDGTKRVRFVLEIENLSAHGDYAFFVFPWSASNGAPTAEVGEVGAEGLGLGRRIMGEPKLYAVKKEQLEAARPSFEGQRDLDASKVPVDGAIDCGRPIRPIHTIGADGPDEIRYRLAVTELSDGTCRTEERATPSLERARQPSGQTPSGGCASCTIGGRPAPAAPGLLASLLLLASLWTRRRR